MSRVRRVAGVGLVLAAYVIAVESAKRAAAAAITAILGQDGGTVTPMPARAPEDVAPATPADEAAAARDRDDGDVDDVG